MLARRGRDRVLMAMVNELVGVLWRIFVDVEEDRSATDWAENEQRQHTQCRCRM
jgi:hypothetical protein